MHTKYDISKFFAQYQVQSSSDELVGKLMSILRRQNNNDQVEKILKNIEHVIYLTYCLIEASNNAERLRMVGAFILYRSNSSVAIKAKDFLMRECPEYFNDKYTLQSQDLRAMLDSWDRANESTLAIKLRAIASYCMAFSVLEHCGFTPGFAEIIYAEFRVQKETKKVTSFAYAILDVIEFVLSRARICWDSGSLQPLFHSSSTYLDWYAKVDEVRLLSRMRGSPDDIEGLRDQDYYLLLEECISKGESMLSFTKTAAERKTMGMIISELKILRHNSAIEQSVSRPREEPLGILVPGDPGIGKSSVTHILGKHYAMVRGINFTPECRFDRNPFDDFMSGFKSSMWFIVMDDVACLEPKKCPAGDKSLSDVIQLINMAPYTSNQAELEKKGKVPVLAKLVVANTNVLDMNAFHYYSHPSAMQRRFKFVLIPFVKSQFCKKDSEGNLINMLDGEKANKWVEEKKKELGHDVEPLPDYWDFIVMEWLPVPIGGPKKLATESYPFGYLDNGEPKRIGMASFLNYYTDKIETHIKNQARMLANMSAMRSVKSCGVCGRSLQFCTNREEHKKFDTIECRVCKKIDCIHKHQCNRCDCMGITARCVKCNNNCAHNMFIEFCNECFDTQSITITQNNEPEIMDDGDRQCLCQKDDCLWKAYPDAIGGVCEDCGYCMSEEDVIEESCTVCLVQEYTINHYETQSLGESYAMWFALYVCAFLMQLKRLDVRPSLIQAQQQRLAVVVDRGQSLLTAATVCDDIMSSIYNQMAYTRRVIVQIGHNAEQTLQSRPAMIIMGAVLSLIALAKTCLGASKYFTSQSDTVVPIPMQEKVDPWKINNYVLTPMDLGRKTKNLRDWSISDISSMLINNCFIADLDLGWIERTRLLAICDRYYAINTHALHGKDSFKITLMRSVRHSVGNSVNNLLIEKHQIYCLSEDITIIYIPQLPNRKDIRELFAKKSYNGTSHGHYIYKNDDGDHDILNIARIKSYLFKHPKLNNGIEYRIYEGKCEKNTQLGYCGSPMVAMTHYGPAILGIHSAGNQSKSVIASPIYHEDVVEFFNDKIIVDTNIVPLQCDEMEYDLQGLNEKSCFRYIEEGSVSIYGSLKGPRSTSKSMVQNTMISQYLVDQYGYKINHGPPVLSGYKPIHLALAPMVDGAFLLPHSLIREGVKDYFDTVSSKLSPDEYCILSKLDMSVVINGADGIRGIDKINMNTSAGFPWKKGKKSLFDLTPKGYTMSSELTQVVDKAIINYKNHRRNNFVFVGSFKDEPKEFSKIASGKTRVFTGQNVAHLLIGRQYYLSFIRLMQRNNLIFENAVGCNAHSDDWDKIAHYLIDFASNLFDGDYKNYDKSMMAMVIMEIFDGIIEFHRHYSTMDEEDFVVMRGVAYDIAYAYVDYFGDLVSFLRNNPSGHLLTVIINSICGSVYLRIGFHMSTQLPMSSYRYKVRAITYGDDVIISVKDDVANQFNFETYRDVMAAYNIVFTPASKDDSSYQFKPLAEIDFLKRSFVYNEELKRYSSPLSKSSIEKSLLVCVRSKSITKEEQIVATISSAQREMWQHGRTAFENFTNVMRDVINHHKLWSYTNKTTLLSYEQLLQYYSGESLTSSSMVQLDYASYETQSSWISTYFKSDYPTQSSYCSNINSTNVGKSGNCVLTHQGVPQSSFLGKIRLVIASAIFIIAMIVCNSEHSSIAQIYNKENMDDLIQKEQGSTTLKTQIFTGVTGEGGAIQEEKRDYANTGTNNPVSMELANFLSRPFSLYTWNWTPSSGLQGEYDVFKDWASNTAVSLKLSNYAFIRGKMCVRIVVDSTPFNFGLLQFSCLAGARTVGLTDVNKALYYSYFSQRPGGYINPSYQKSLDLSATLLHRGEWYSLDGNGSHNYPEPGVILSVLTGVNLASATANSATNVTVRVYAWMEDVELAGSTYVVQSMSVFPHAVSSVSSTPDSISVQLKECNLNPGKGLPALDMTMKSYLSVNPIVAQFPYADTAAPGDLLTRIRPCPGVNSITNVSGTNIQSTTPLSFLDRYFDHWRGSLIFTFRVNCSQYHSGSLRVTWDPLTTQGGEANVQLTKIVNIQEEQEFEFIVPHNNNCYAFDTDSGLPFPVVHVSTGVAYDAGKNGILSIKVMNRLTGPTDGQVVFVTVHMRPGPDFHFLRLSDGTNDIGSSYKVQSQSISYVETNEEQYFGEAYDDLSAICQRPQFYNLHFAGSVSGVGTNMNVVASRYPMTPGPSTYGNWIKNNISNFVPVTTPKSDINTFINVKNTFLAQLIQQFVGVAGSMVHTLVLNDITDAYISLGTKFDRPNDIILPLGTFTNYSAGPPVNYARFVKTTVTVDNVIQARLNNNWRGAQWMSSVVNNIGHFRLPFLSKYKYIPTNDYGEWDCVRYYFRDVGSDAAVESYLSAGPDFSLIQFSGVLPMGVIPNTQTSDTLFPLFNGINRSI